MIGLLLVFYLGKQFYTLADQFGKNKWGFGILGVVFYLLGTFLFGVIFSLLAIYTDNSDMLGTSEMFLNLLSIPFGLLLAWGLYASLKKSWSKVESNDIDAELLDDTI
jgi:uncharacterized Tic20 family protein